MSDLRKKDSGNWEAPYRFRDARTGNILRRGRTFKTRRDTEARAHSDHRASPRLPPRRPTPCTVPAHWRRAAVGRDPSLAVLGKGASVHGAGALEASDDHQVDFREVASDVACSSARSDASSCGRLIAIAPTSRPLSSQ
jgi:hypothetical protein